MRFLSVALLALPVLVAARPARHRRACTPSTNSTTPTTPPTTTPTTPTNPPSDPPSTTPNTNSSLPLMRGYPADGIRGVNFGSYLLIEPWMMSKGWEDMGGENCDNCMDCASTEFDLVKKLGQDAADAAFDKHWDSFITKDDVDLIKEYNLNSVRIPLGFWIIEEAVNRDNEYYPRGGLDKLRRMCGWLADAGITVLLDLHAAPGGSTRTNAFAGRCVDPPQFWSSDDNKQRHLQAAKKLTELVHQEPENFRSVWGLEMLNEPPQNGDEAPGYAQLMKDFVKIVRDAEASLNVEDGNKLQTVFMDKSWMWQNADGNNPAMAANGGSAYDTHTYYSFGGAWGANGANSGDDLESHIRFACDGDGGKLAADIQDHNDPVFTGEWWLVAKNQQILDHFDKENVKRFGDAQKWGRSKQSGKGGSGYYFWSWKITNEDGGGWTHMRSYKDAVEQGYLHRDAAQYFNPNICG